MSDTSPGSKPSFPRDSLTLIRGVKATSDLVMGRQLTLSAQSHFPPVGVKAHHPQRSLASVKGSEAVSVGRLELLTRRSPSRSVSISMGEGVLPKGRHGPIGCESLMSQPQLPGPAYRGSWSYPYQRGLENPSAVRNTRILVHYRPYQHMATWARAPTRARLWCSNQRQSLSPCR